MNAELATLASPDDIANLPAEQRGYLITQALVESKQWLAVATKGTDPTPLAEFKAWAATVAEMTRQKGLAEDIQLDAVEMVRRAERGIGQAIRNGQAAGEIAKLGSLGGERGPDGTFAPATPGTARRQHLARPTDFATVNELSSNQAGIYALTDGVTDEDFDEVIDEARGELNLSRGNVARKAREVRDAREELEASGWDAPREKRSLEERIAQVRELAESTHSSRQIAEIVGMGITSLRRFAIRHGITITADAVIPDRTRRIDPTRVITQTVDALEGLAMGLQLLTADDYASLDTALVKEWAKSLRGSLSAVNDMKKEVTRRARN